MRELIRRWTGALSVPIAAAVVVMGCTAEPALEPSDGDQLAEVSLTAAELREQYDREGDYFVSPVLEAPSGATRAGFLVAVDSESYPMPGIEVRGLDELGAPMSWKPAELTWSEAGQRVARAELGGAAFAAQIRIPAADANAIEALTWSVLVPAHEQEHGEPAVDAHRSELRSELGDLGIRTRSQWGARGTRCRSSDSSKYRMAIHHTVTPAGGNIASRVRGIQSYHMDTRGWCDIGYHFLVSTDGRLWEGRPLRLLGTHVGGHNTGNIGISFIGCFHSSGCRDWRPFVPPDASIDAAGRLVGQLSGLYGIEVNRSRVKGHRDHGGQTTSCPGDHLHARLDRIRDRASGPAPFAAEYVNQTFPLAREPFEVPAGQEVEGYIEMRNTGARTWEPGKTMLGTTEPRDEESPLQASDWVSPTRPATIDREVPPGETGRFNFSVRAPNELGDYPQFFNLVHEGEAWFSDPGQGGPPDAQLQVRVTAVEGSYVNAGAERVVYSPTERVTTSTSWPAPEPDRDSTTHAMSGGGCHLAPAGAGRPAGSAGALALLAGLCVALRRRTGRPSRR